MNEIYFKLLKNELDRIKITRDINTHILHCAATPEGREHDVEDIRRWHLDRGFRDVGYHFVIKLNGEIEFGRPLNQVGAHVSGHNTGSIGTCYIGGLCEDMSVKDTRTLEQKQSMSFLVNYFKERFPGIATRGHNEFANRGCPSFDVSKETWSYRPDGTYEETFESLANKILFEWAKPKGLLNPDNYQAQAMKVIEEIGETYGAALKGNREELVDGFGDVFVTLIILAEQLNVNPVEALNIAYEEISGRTGTLKGGVFVKD